jgi:hypothetical protein
VLTGLAAAGLLLVLMVGVPRLLVRIGPDLVDLPTVAGTMPQALWQPDDGTLLIALALVGAWVAWAVVAVSVLLEVIAHLRGVSAPRLPAIGAIQQVVAALVSAVLLLTGPSAPLGHAGASPPTSITAPHLPSHLPGTAAGVHTAFESGTPSTEQPSSSPPVAGHPPSPARAAASSEPDPVVVVARHDTLWGLAERHLGSGQRWREILTLNRGRPQPDGGMLTDAAHLLPGWRLRLPADAHLPNRSDPRPDTDPAAHVVQAGDTLWDIAEDHLGDPLAYRSVYRANAGDPQPDGRRLTNPDLIHPGWQLNLPNARAGTDGGGDRPGVNGARTTPEGDARRSAPQPTAPAPAKPERSPRAPRVGARSPAARTQPDRAPDPAPGVAGSPDATPTTPATPPTTPEDISGAPRAVPMDADGNTPPLPPVVLGLSTLLLAGMIAELARRRGRQRRHRPVGHVLPIPEGPPARTEQAARAAAAAAPDPAAVRAALQRLAGACRHADQPLPNLAWLTVDDEQLLLHLHPNQPPLPPPAQQVDEHQWRLPLHTEADETGDDDHDGPAAAERATGSPYPALLTVGVDPDGRHVQVNLDSVGELVVTGRPDQTKPVLNAAVLELALTAHHSDVRVTTDLPHQTIAAAFPHLAAPTGGLAAGMLHQLNSTAATLADLGTPDLRTARSQHPEQAPATHVVVSDRPLGLRVRPWTGICAVRASSVTVPDGWRITIAPDGTATLHPAGVAISVAAVGDEEFDRLLHVLHVADQPTHPLDVVPIDDHATDDTGTDTAEDPDDAQLTGADDAGRLDCRRHGEQDEPSGWPEPASAVTSLPLLPVRTSRSTSDDGGEIKAAAAADLTGWAQVGVLGPVVVQHPTTDFTHPRRARGVELIVFLAVTCKASPHVLDEAIWPAQRVSNTARNAFVHRVRDWLGTAPDGQPYLPEVKDGGDYRLHPVVATDWQQFTALAASGMAAGPEGLPDLEAALALVRGRPFQGIDPAHYTWAEPHTQDMIITITDVCHHTYQAHADARRWRHAARAATLGLHVDPGHDQLTEDALHAAHTLGDTDLGQRLQARRDAVEDW